MKKKSSAIFFDLDGTLLDTAPDLHTAMLVTLEQLGKDTISFEQFRPHIHTGTKSMLMASLNLSEEDPEFLTIRDIFLGHYRHFLNEKTDYFPGMENVLTVLDQEQIPWGIVTNKPGFLTDPLLVSFGLDKRSHCIISGDTLPKRKPHPAPLLYACELTSTQPQNSFYVGDTQNDVIAAKAAGMTAIAVLYGYHDPSTQPETWGADHLIENSLKILEILSN